MITNRERRKTAGNKYSQVVAQEQAEEDEGEDDDVALLFKELGEEEDEEYNSAEADDEADMSSSDDDDQGPNAAADDVDGEQELQRQAKVEKQKKRKADMAMTTMDAIRKKPKLDPTALHRAPEKKPSKRKERVSWLPDQSSAPGRTSLRKQTVAHREVLLKNLQEQEEQRLKNKAHREEKERKKLADAPRKLTQADRLAEAEKNERRNAKSLNRWETMEKQRAEEQAARLAPLKDRKMHGPVVTFYSTRYAYKGPKIEDINNPSARDDQLPRKRGPKPKPLLQQVQETPSQLPTRAHSPSAMTATHANADASHQGTPATFTADSQHGPDSWLAGIHEYAAQPGSGSATPQHVPSNINSVEQKLTTSGFDIHGNQKGNLPTKIAVRPQVVVNIPPRPTPIHMKPILHVAELPAHSSPLPLPSVSAHSQPLLSSAQPRYKLGMPNLETNYASHSLATSKNSTPISAQPTSEQPMLEETISTRNVIILQDFDKLAAHAKQAFDALQQSKKSARPIKHVGEICLISGLPAKYRDRVTGVPFANLTAGRKLKEIQKHQHRWSTMLGCYIGRVGHVARGVPDGFLGT